MKNILELYSEPAIFEKLITYFSFTSYFLMILILLYTFRLAYYAKKNVIISNKIIWLVTTWITLINYNYHVHMSIVLISLLYIGVAYISYKWIEAKSLKWINLSMALFVLFIIASYNLFNTEIHRVSYPFFLANDILNYDFTFKPYFEIYNPSYNSLLGKITFSVDGKSFEIMNMPIEHRIYTFYYVLNTIALLFWIVIYWDILKKHNLNIKKICKGQKSNFFFIMPEKLNPVMKKPLYLKTDIEPEKKIETI